jgi:hypothetical protein
MPRRPVVPSVALVFCLVLVLGSPGATLCAVQEEDKAKQDDSTKQDAAGKGNKPAPSEERKQADEDVVVITNEDLERMFSDPAAPPEGALSLPPADTPAGEGEPAARPSDKAPSGSAPQAADPLKWMQDRQARQAEWSRQVAEAQQAVSDAEARVADLQKRLLATRNPLLARPEIPDDEKEEWAELNGPGRVELTQQQLETARAELAEAQQKLARLQSQKPL